MTDHITIPPVSPVIQYVANGSQTVFSFPFPIFDNDDMVVSLNGAVQTSGYSITGAGQSNGGTVTFVSAPANTIIVRLERRLAIARTTDFLDGGDFAARSLNNELDYVVASVQQVQADQAGMLRFDNAEIPDRVTLPDRGMRANKALGFDGDGNPVAYAVGTVSAPDNYNVTGTGAVSRPINDKMGEYVSVKDFGAVGNGVANDTLAFQQAIAAHRNVFVPAGTYLISSSLELLEGRRLYGAGQQSIIRATNNTFDLIRLPAGYTKIENLRLENGLSGIKLFGRDAACVQNAIVDISIWGADYGLYLDGYNDTNRPCYWNNIDRVLIAQPKVHGIWFNKTGAGDTPNANRFGKVRVYSLGQSMTGSGLYIQHGKYNNSFVDCEFDLHPSAHSCVRVGANAEKNLFVNLYTETTGSVTNVLLESGSLETSITNLFSASAGAAILDQSGGNYDAYNAGFPDKNRLRKTRIKDLTAEIIRFDTQFIDQPGAYTLNVDQTTSFYLVSSFNGAVTVNLPNASTAPGAMLTIKKTDLSANAITIQETGGSGPDGRAIKLTSRYDYITMVSNGANWWITSHNLTPNNARFVDGVTLFEPDLTRQLYLISSFSGATEVRLPPANAANAAGRIVTIKKSDVSGNNVTVTESGGSGPDGASFVLNAQYKAVTVMSNGANYFILSQK